MSVSVLIYLGVVAALWPVCAFAVRRVASSGLIDRAVARLVTAMAWPITVRVLAFAGVRRSTRRPHLRLVSDGLETLAYDAPRRVAVGR